eukprot:s1869_g3.t1
MCVTRLANSACEVGPQASDHGRSRTVSQECEALSQHLGDRVRVSSLTEWLQPNLKTQNALLACCTEAGQWQFSLAALEENPSLGHRSTPQSFNIVLDALHRSGSKWPHCLHLFEEIPARTSRPPNLISSEVILEECAGARLWEGALAMQGAAALLRRTR